jgi:hypothetical protein
MGRQYGNYFARLYGPGFFVFAVVTTVLNSMQVGAGRRSSSFRTMALAVAESPLLHCNCLDRGSHSFDLSYFSVVVASPGRVDILCKISPKRESRPQSTSMSIVIYKFKNFVHFSLEISKCPSLTFLHVNVESYFHARCHTILKSPFGRLPPLVMPLISPYRPFDMAFGQGL